MNISKKNKINPDSAKGPQSKSFLIISSNYKVESLYHILVKSPTLINQKDQKNETLLSYALKRKNIDIAELLLTSPILDYTYQDLQGNSYLHLAVINELEMLIQTILDKIQNKNIQNNDGNTALHFAYSTGNDKIINMIIGSGIDFTIKNNQNLIAEEIKKGTFQQIIDISFFNNSNNSTPNNSQEILNGSKDENELKESNNEKINNERGEINKSIRINWDNNINNKNDNNNELNKISTNVSKLKYSLVDMDYSDDEDNGKHEPNISEIITNDINVSNNKNKEENKEIKDSMQDFFNLTDSISYKEKIASDSLLNSHVVGPINEDIVNFDADKLNSNKNVSQFAKNNNIPIQNNFDINTNLLSVNTDYNPENRSNLSVISNNNLPKSTVNEKRYETFNDKNALILPNDSTKISEVYAKPLINCTKNKNFKAQIDLEQEFTTFSPVTTMKEINKEENNNLNNNNISNNNISNNNISNNNINNNNISNNHISNNINNKNNKSNNNISNNTSNNNISNTHISEYKRKMQINIQKNELANGCTHKPNNPQGNNYNNKQEPKKIINSNNINSINLNQPKTKFSPALNSTIKNNNDLTEYNNINTNKTLFAFLSEINMEKYFGQMNKNGFDDINCLIENTKSNSITVTDKQLKEAGVNLPGDRAKILIRLQEKAKNFAYQVPRNVYYVCKDLEHIPKESCINKLNDWLKNLKLEEYLKSFISNGYQSRELMLLQMESKNELTDDILKDEIGISKIGHRARILNKLRDEGKSLNHKLKTSVLVVNNGGTTKNCECNIY